MREALKHQQYCREKKITGMARSNARKQFLAGKSPAEQQFILQVLKKSETKHQKTLTAQKDRNKKLGEYHEKLELVFHAQRDWEQATHRDGVYSHIMQTTRDFYLKNKQLPELSQLAQLTELSEKQIMAFIRVAYKQEFRPKIIK